MKLFKTLTGITGILLFSLSLVNCSSLNEDEKLLKKIDEIKEIIIPHLEEYLDYDIKMNKEKSLENSKLSSKSLIQKTLKSDTKEYYEHELDANNIKTKYKLINTFIKDDLYYHYEETNKGIKNYRIKTSDIEKINQDFNELVTLKNTYKLLNEILDETKDVIKKTGENFTGTYVITSNDSSHLDITLNYSSSLTYPLKLEEHYIIKDNKLTSLYRKSTSIIEDKPFYEIIDASMNYNDISVKHLDLE